MAGTAVVGKKMNDLVKLVNTGKTLEEFQSNCETFRIKSGESRVMTRDIAMHGIEKTLKPITIGEGKTQIKEYASELIIDELPDDKRSMESLAKSANDVVQLTGEVDTLEKTIAEQEETIKNLTSENANLKAKIKKLDK